MRPHVTLACLVVLSCLLPSTLSVHKKKIIVKVPHLIKHIHHNHFKPFHVHKVHAKKVEHHHHEDHEDSSSKWKSGKVTVKKGKHRLRGSFGDVKPFLLHQEIEEHLEYPGFDGQDHNKRAGHKLELDKVPIRNFNLEDIPWGSAEEFAEHRSPFIEEGVSRGNGFNRHTSRFNRENYFSQGNTGLKPIDFSTWLNENVGEGGSHSGEDLVVTNNHLPHKNKKIYFENQKNIATKKPLFDNGPKVQKSKQLNWRLEETDIGMENEGWKPMFNEYVRENFKDIESNHQHNLGDHFIDSGEQMSVLSEPLYSTMEEENYKRNKKRKQTRKKKEKVAQKHEDLDYEGLDHKSIKRKLPQQTYQTESPQRLNYQVQPQFSQQLQPLPTQPYPSLPPQTQMTWPNPNWSSQQIPAPSWQNQPTLQNPIQMIPQHQIQAIHQQQTQAILQHQLQSQPQPQPTLSPKTVWSGHQLHMPQLSMWHVQQHSDGPPHQILTVNQSPLQPLQFHQPHTLNHQAQPEPQQLTVGSSPVHHVMLPDWPLTRKSPDSSVKQHWEQHVQTSGSDGPASSYRVEVINYNDKKNSR